MTKEMLASWFFGELTSTLNPTLSMFYIAHARVYGKTGIRKLIPRQIHTLQVHIYHEKSKKHQFYMFCEGILCSYTLSMKKKMYQFIISLLVTIWSAINKSKHLKG